LEVWNLNGIPAAWQSNPAWYRCLDWYWHYYTWRHASRRWWYRWDWDRWSR